MNGLVAPTKRVSGCLTKGILLLLAVTITNAQTLEGEVVQDPRAGLAIYDFHFDGPPRNAPYLFLPSFPSLPDPFTPWLGSFALPGADPLFSFNLKIENPSTGHIKISDGDEIIDGINPGITCLSLEGCNPINFILPFQFVPDPSFIPFENFAVEFELNATNVSSQPIIIGEPSPFPPPVLDLSFINPFQPHFNPALADLFPVPQLIDPLNPPLDPLIPLNPPLLDPLGSGSLQLPIPPDPQLAGLSLFHQGFVLDPMAAQFGLTGVQSGQTVNLNDSINIVITPVPEPATVFLLGLAILWLAIIKKNHRSKSDVSTAPYKNKKDKALPGGHPKSRIDKFMTGMLRIPEQTLRMRIFKRHDKLCVQRRYSMVIQIFNGKGL